MEGEGSALQPPEGLHFDEVSRIRVIDPEKHQVRKRSMSEWQ